MNIGIILAAGLGRRFNSSIHKQYLKLNGKEMVYYSLNEMRNAKNIDEVLLVVDHEEYDEGYIQNKYQVKCISGGETRNKSIKNALDYIKQNYSCDNVIFQDAVRPFVKSHVFDKYLEELKDKDAVFSTTEISDSLGTNEGQYVNRENYFLIQTPEAFNFPILYDLFDKESDATAIIHQVHGKCKTKRIHETAFNMKITYPEDLFLAEQFMRINYYRNYGESQSVNYDIGNVLLLGGSGGIGGALIDVFEKNNIPYFAPTHRELDLSDLSVDRLVNSLPTDFIPDVIINAAAVYANDSQGILEHYNEIFDINLRSNIVLMEYAQRQNRPMRLVLISSSSSTKGREDLTNYSAAKSALNSIVESRAHDLAAREIYVNAIIPEKVNTALIAKLHNVEINKRELLEANDVINAIIKYSSTTEYGQLVHIRKGL